MSPLYPPIEPYDHGMLDVGDGHRVYWEVCGNPDGKPALAVHGGPGVGCSPNIRRYFDPAAYRIVLFDQRQCGRSTPHAGQPDVDLSTNTTDALLGDMELLRTHLGIEKWFLFGGSWGSVLGLTYALRHPDRVSEIVMMGIATDRHVEMDLLVNGLGRFFPQDWAKFRAAAGNPDGEITAAYQRLLTDPDPAVHNAAARAWCDWEEAIDVTLDGPNPRFDDPEFRLAFARIVTLYWSNQCWLPDGETVRRAGELAGIPGVLVQGSLDPGNLVGTSWILAHAWPGCELTVINDAGHSSVDAGMPEKLVAATDRFR